MTAPPPASAAARAARLDPGAQERLLRLTAFLAQDPGNRRLRQDVFETAMQAGRLDIAQAQVEHVLAIDPEAPVARHNLVLLLLARGDAVGAEAALRRLFEAGHDAPALHFNLARSLFDQGRHAEALEETAPLHAGNDTPALVLHLRCLHCLGRVDEALDLARAALAAGRLDAELFGVASLLAFDGEDLDAARAWSGTELKRAPHQLEALVTAGCCALAVSDAAGAHAILRRALDVSPRDGRTWSAMGLCEMMRMRIGDAIIAFERAVETMPGHIGTWHALGWCQIISNLLPAARSTFRHALDMDHNFAESHGGLAVIQALSGEVAEAAESIRRALKLDPDSMAARYAQAVLAGEHMDPQAVSLLADSLLKTQRRNARRERLQRLHDGRSEAGGEAEE